MMFGSDQARATIAKHPLDMMSFVPPSSVITLPYAFIAAEIGAIANNAIMYLNREAQKLLTAVYAKAVRNELVRHNATQTKVYAGNALKTIAEPIRESQMK
jgi:hypothetical protein